MDVKIDLAAYLAEMRQEQRNNHAAVMTELKAVATINADHETRITVIENNAKLVKWAGAGLITGVVGFLVDMVKNHGILGR